MPCVLSLKLSFGKQFCHPPPPPRSGRFFPLRGSFSKHTLTMTFERHRTMQVPTAPPATGVVGDTKPRVLLMGNKR